MWRSKLRKIYADYEEFAAYADIYNLHGRLGYLTPQEAWEDNPMVQGSVKPEDYRRVCPTGYRFKKGRGCVKVRRK